MNAKNVRGQFGAWPGLYPLPAHGEQTISRSVCYTAYQNAGGYGVTIYVGCTTECHCFAGRVWGRSCCLVDRRFAEIHLCHV